MKINPTQSGGRKVQGKTPYGDYMAEWDKDGKLIAEKCVIKTPNTASKGLGDTIAKVTDKLGIRKCGGCKQRQRKLNEIFPYNNQGET